MFAIAARLLGQETLRVYLGELRWLAVLAWRLWLEFAASAVEHVRMDPSHRDVAESGC